MLDFHPGSERALPAHSGHPITFPFWESGPPSPPTSSPFTSPFTSRLQATRVNGSMALISVFYWYIYIGFETAPGSSGAVLDTLALGWWGRKPFTVAHAGKYMLISFGYSISWYKRSGTSPRGPISHCFCPLAQGGGNTKNHDCGQSRCAVVSRFQVFLLIHIGGWITPFPCRFIYTYCFGSCGCSGTKISNCDPVWRILVSLLYSLIILIDSPKSLYFLFQ